MERYRERDLEILTAIGEGRPLTQRALAQRLGVALGLTNLYLKRLAKKGLIKITEFPRKPHAQKRLRQDVTQALLGVGLPRKFRDLDQAFLGQAFEVEVGQAQRDPETLRQRALREGAPFADGGEDLEVPFAIAFHETPR